MAARAVIEQLREEAHELRDLLTEAYFKIAILEEAADNPSQPSEPPDKANIPAGARVGDAGWRA